MRMDTPVLFSLVGQPLPISRVECFCVEIKPAALLAIMAGAWDHSLHKTKPKCPWVKETDLAQETGAPYEVVLN